MKALIQTIVQGLVDYPNDIRIEEKEDDNRLTYQLFVHPEDVGKVIGKQGRIAKALRTVVYAAAAKENRKIYIDIM